MFKTRFISMLVLLMTAVTGAWATITVTWNNDDITGGGNSFTKDGVTITAGSIDFNQKNFIEGGTFTTTLGNFTKIVVTTGDCGATGTGWSGSTWTGNASSVSFEGHINGDGQGNTKFVFTIEPPTVAVTGITLDKTEASMIVGGETLTLTATVAPNDATDKTVTWTTSDAAVATVADGVVTAVGAGTATITATSNDGSGKQATCTVTVSPAGYSVALKDGTDDATNWQGKAGEGEYQSLPLEGVAANTAVSVKYSGAKKVKSVKAVKKPGLPVVNGKFSVSDSKQVYFSKGNLRYASGAWSFFDNQYDFYNSYSADAWDHFGWSTSTTYGMNTSENNNDYSGDFVDWGATMGTGWFTLSKDEWTYLFNTRSASTVNGTANGRYAKAKVNDVQGMILFPDTYTHPDDVTVPTGVNATDNTGWNGNNYSSADWTKMESAGCVFLPAAGYRGGSTVGDVGKIGDYWSATTHDNTANAYYMNFTSGTLNPAGAGRRKYAYSVRLVWQVTE